MSARTSATVLGPTSTVSVAPNSTAFSSRNLLVSTAITRAAPQSPVVRMAERPTAPAPTTATVSPGPHATGQDPDLVPGGQRVGQEDRLLVRHVLGQVVQRGVRVGHPHGLGLGAVDQVPEDPADAADGLAVRGHVALAVLAPSAARDGRHQDPVADLERADGVADRRDRADRLVAEDAALGHGRDVTGQDVQVGAADGGGVDAYDDVGRVLDRCVGDVVPGLLPGAVVDECLHGSSSWESGGRASVASCSRR